MRPDRIDNRQAHDILESRKDAVYIDVRTEEEFNAGHPEGAVNIPIGVPNPMMQRFDVNPDFVDVVRASWPENTTLLVGCRTGPRAEMAAQLLAQKGYMKVSWVLGGFAGITDPAGNVVAPGWQQLGYPESREPREGASYPALRKKAGKA